MEEFDQIINEISEVCKKYNVELIIKSEISFKKLDGGSTENTNTKTKESGTKDN